MNYPVLKGGSWFVFEGCLYEARYMSGTKGGDNIGAKRVLRVFVVRNLEDPKKDLTTPGLNGIE